MCDVFYVISFTHNNSNDADDQVIVSRNPAIGNFDRKPVLEGWAGSINDLSTHAHGKYTTADAAQAVAIDVALTLSNGSGSREADLSDIEIATGISFKLFVGALESLNKDASHGWLWAATEEPGFATANLAELTVELIEIARDDGFAIDPDLAIEYLTERQQEVREDSAAALII